MSYNRWLTGSAEIKPPLAEKVINDLQNKHNSGDMPDLLLDYFEVEEGGTPDRVELVKGEITVIPGNRSMVVGIPGDLESANFSDFEEKCQILFDGVKKAGSTIEGAFNIYGEDHGDISRVSFRNGAFFDERPKLLWPDGTQEDVR